MFHAPHQATTNRRQQSPIASHLRSFLIASMALLSLSCRDMVGPLATTRIGPPSLPSRTITGPNLVITTMDWFPEGDYTVSADAMPSATYLYVWSSCNIANGEDPDIVCGPQVEYNPMGDIVGPTSSWTMWMASSTYQIRIRVQLRAWVNGTPGDVLDEKIVTISGPASPFQPAPPDWLNLPSNFSWSACHMPTSDADQDGIDDRCEYEVAWSFRPRLVLNSDEPWPGREPYWTVKDGPDANTLSIFYALSYYTDGGTRRENLPIGGAHYGDSEFIILTVGLVPGLPNRWQLQKATLSAHWGVGNGGNYTTYKTADDLQYRPGDRRKTRPMVYVAWGKHGNYSDQASCEHGGVTYDSCSLAVDDGSEVEVLEGANLGNNFSKPGVATIINCQVSRGGWGVFRPGVECFWDPIPTFNGWSGFDDLGGSTAYRELFEYFGF